MQRLKRGQRPTVLSLNGKAELVVQDAAAHQEILETLEAAQTKQGIIEVTDLGAIRARAMGWPAVTQSGIARPATAYQA